MTYGWAILIVIIVAAALYALGVFNLGTVVGPTATGFGAMGAPEDWTLESNGDFKVTVANNKLSSQVTIMTITGTLKGGNTITYNTSNCTGGGIGTYLTLGPGASTALETACGAAYNLTFGAISSGSSYSIDISMLYNTGGYDKTDSGTVTGVVS
ncbi:MAG: hypothetical protein JSV39_01485 [Candidatus Aenigmatarchaeota archaeon]|nr:MAG: hypothetical protein JSV39_01485 [Candidatus Aenigmarchaeota archaeon]